MNEESSTSENNMAIDDSVGDEFSPVDNSTTMKEFGVMQSVENNTRPTFGGYFEETVVGSADDDVEYIESPTGTYTTPLLL